MLKRSDAELKANVFFYACNQAERKKLFRGGENADTAFGGFDGVLMWNSTRLKRGKGDAFP